MNERQRLFLYRTIYWPSFLAVFSSILALLLSNISWQNVLPEYTVFIFTLCVVCFTLRHSLYEYENIYDKYFNIFIASVPLIMLSSFFVFGNLLGNYALEIKMFETSGIIFLFSITLFYSSVYLCFYKELGARGRNKFIFRSACFPIYLMLISALYGEFSRSSDGKYLHSTDFFDTWGSHQIYMDSMFTFMLNFITLLCLIVLIMYFSIYYKNGIYRGKMDYYLVIFSSIPLLFSIIAFSGSYYSATNSGYDVTTIIPSTGYARLHAVYPVVIFALSLWYTTFRSMSTK